jgi:hypothetical protein
LSKTDNKLLGIRNSTRPTLPPTSKYHFNPSSTKENIAASLLILSNSKLLCDNITKEGK